MFNKNGLSSNFSRSWIIPLRGKKISQRCFSANQKCQWNFRMMPFSRFPLQPPPGTPSSAGGIAQRSPGSHRAPVAGSLCHQTALDRSGVSSCFPPTGHSNKPQSRAALLFISSDKQEDKFSYLFMLACKYFENTPAVLIKFSSKKEDAQTITRPKTSSKTHVCRSSAQFFLLLLSNINIFASTKTRRWVQN